jgi:hypothetical protein
MPLGEADPAASAARPLSERPTPPPGDHGPLSEHLSADGAAARPAAGTGPDRAFDDALPMSREPDTQGEPGDRPREPWQGETGGDDDEDSPDFDDILARLESQERERSGRAGRAGADEEDLFGDDDDLPDVLRGRLQGERRGGRRKRPPAWASWSLVGLILVAGALGALYFLRYNVIELYPEAEDIYASLGIPLDRPGLGLWLRERGSTREMEDGKEVLVVRGFITNVSEAERPVPALRLALTDADGEMVQQKTDPPPKDALAPGETIPYRIVMRNRLPESVGIVVTFVERPAGPILTPPPRDDASGQ